MRDTYAFSVNEILDDGRVLVTTYVRMGRDIYLNMTLYSTETLSAGGEKLLDIHMLNGKPPTPINADPSPY